MGLQCLPPAQLQPAHSGPDPSPGWMEPPRRPRRGLGISIFETPRSQRNTDLSKINSICHRLGSLEADAETEMGCRKFVSDQQLWQERERCRIGRGNNQRKCEGGQQSLGHPGGEHGSIPVRDVLIRPEWLETCTRPQLSPYMQGNWGRGWHRWPLQLRLTLKELKTRCCLVYHLIIVESGWQKQLHTLVSF